MTVGLDAYTDGPGSATTFSYTHVVSGTPRAAVVFVTYTTFDAIGVTYGGTAMTEVATADNTVGGELAFIRQSIFFLDNVASGNQTVASTGGTSQAKVASSYTLTSAGNAIESVDDVTAESTAIANPSTTLALGGRDSWCGIIFGSGQDAVGGVTPFTNWTPRREIDNGTSVSGWYSYDTIASSDVGAGWTQTSDDAFYVAAAFAEAAGGRIMSSIAGPGGLVSAGGIVGIGGGLAR